MWLEAGSMRNTVEYVGHGKFVERVPDPPPVCVPATVHNETDCRDEAGITVGLIDSLISISRVLVGRDWTAPVVVEALKDLRQDLDMKKILEEVINA